MGGLADPRVTAAVVNRKELDGGTSFCQAAHLARDKGRVLHPERRARAVSCARLVACSCKCDPSAVDGEGRTHLMWANTIGLCDVVKRWLSDLRVTPAVVNWKDTFGCTAFYAATCFVLDEQTPGTFEERARAATCAYHLASSGLCDPCTIGYGGLTHLQIAVQARFSHVLEVWLSDPRVTAAVLNRRDGNGLSLFAAAAYNAVDVGRKLSHAERAKAADCARLIGLSGLFDPAAQTGGRGVTNVAVATAAGLHDVVKHRQTRGNTARRR